MAILSRQSLSVLVTLIALVAGSTAAHAQVHGVRSQEQRSVGYLIGDRIPRRIAIDHAPGWTLQTAALPAPGPQNYWLELRDVSTRQVPGKAHDTTYVDLDYQSFYAPIAVRELQLPALELRLVRGDEVAIANVPPWAFTTAPLREVQLVGANDGGEDWLTPRDDRRPAVLSTSLARTRLLIGSTLALAAALLLAWQYGRFPFRPGSARPFARAARDLRRSATADSPRSTFLRLHEAFNQHAGQVLLADDLDDWLRENPAFASHRDAITRWFQASRRLFFADDEAGARAAFDPPALRRLAADLAASERRA